MRALGPWIAHLSPGTWVDDVLAYVWLGRYDLKIFLFLVLVAMIFSQAKPSYQFLVEGNMGSIFVKLFWFWISGSGGDFIWRNFLSRALEVLLFSRAEPFVQLWKRVLWGTILWNYFEFGPVFRRCCLKDISYLGLWQWSRTIKNFQR